MYKAFVEGRFIFLKLLDEHGIKQKKGVIVKAIPLPYELRECGDHFLILSVLQSA